MTPIEDVAEALLAEAVAGLAAAGGEAAKRVYIASGPAFAHDCRQLVVHADAMPPFQGTTGRLGTLPGASAGPLGVMLVTFTLTFVADCVPIASGQQLPDVDAVTAHATQLLSDWQGIYEQVTSVTDLGGLPDSDYDFDAAASFGPSGRTAGWRLPVRCAFTQ